LRSSLARRLIVLDRLLHHCDVVPINGPSYRPKNRLTAIENIA
jgi:DNA replication protein DnaC